MSKKIIFRWIKVLVLLYSIIGIAFYYLQEKLLFHPVPVSHQTKYVLGQPFTERDLAYDKETNLNVIQFQATDRPADSPARGVILYFQGNKENIGRYAPAARDLTAKGYEVWMMDYPGFGKSTGLLSERKLYEHALVFYKLARSRWAPSQIILYGKDLGTGIAAQLGSVRDCRRLILEDPFYSMTSEMRRYLFLYPVSSLLHYHFPTHEYLQTVTAPVTIYGNTSWPQLQLKPGDGLVTKLDSVLAL